MLPPLNLDRTSRSSGVLPDGRTVPLAWDYTTSQIMAKVEPYMPWSFGDNNRAAAKLAETGQYLADVDIFWRGVWAPAPKDILSAAYSKKHRAEIGSGNPSNFLQLTSGSGGMYLQTTGGGGMQKVQSTVGEAEEEPDEPEVDPEPPNGEDTEEATTASYRASSEYSPRRNRVGKVAPVVTKKKKKR